MKHLFSRKLSLSEAYKQRFVVSGCSWLVYAVSNLFGNIPCRIISIVALLIAIVSTAAFFRKVENEDEMAIKHIYRAKANTHDCMFAVLLICVIISLVGAQFRVDLNDVYGFVLGISNLLTGCLFMHFEKVGD
jgi:uncharacterized membrane protein